MLRGLLLFSHEVMSDSLQLHGLQHFPVLPHLTELAQTHLHWVSDTIQPSHTPLLPSPSSFSLSQYQGPNELTLCTKWLEYWHFSFSIRSTNEYSGLISYRIDWLTPCCSRDSQDFSSTQFESISSSVLNLLYGPTLTSIHDYLEKPKLWLNGPLSAKWHLCFLIHCLGLS